MKQALVRRTIREAKKGCWRGFYDSIGRTTPIGRVWGMVQRMKCVRRVWGYPVMERGGVLTKEDSEKADMLAGALGEVYRSGRSEQLVRGIQNTRAEFREVLEEGAGLGDGALNAPFTLRK